MLDVRIDILFARYYIVRNDRTIVINQGYRVSGNVILMNIGVLLSQSKCDFYPIKQT